MKNLIRILTHGEVKWSAMAGILVLAAYPAKLFSCKGIWRNAKGDGHG